MTLIAIQSSLKEIDVGIAIWGQGDPHFDLMSRNLDIAYAAYLIDQDPVFGSEDLWACDPEFNEGFSKRVAYHAYNNQGKSLRQIDPNIHHSIALEACWDATGEPRHMATIRLGGGQPRTYIVPNDNPLEAFHEMRARFHRDRLASDLLTQKP